MVRSTSRRPRKNKISLALKLRWKSRQQSSEQISTSGIYDASEQINDSDNVEAECSSPSPTNDVVENYEQESEVQQLAKSINNWGTMKYEPNYKIQNETGILTSQEYESIMSHDLCCEIEKPAPSCTISGNRIVELGYVIDRCLNLQYRHLQKCTCGEIKLKGEKRLKGLVSSYILECSQCNETFQINSENPSRGTSVVNAGAVWGTIATGSSHGHLQELLACMDIPGLSNRSFYELEVKMGEEWKASLLKSMKETGIREKENAIGKNQISSDGTPWITVYVDGSWSKRSYGSNYNSMSGMVGIIGKFTGELLYLAVKNKYCSICARTENTSQETKSHVCYKNWSGSSPAMEADLVVNGFRDSINTHGIKYNKFVGDGDSSVYARIKEQVPYGYEVCKIECTNHALKNYGKNLYKLKKDVHIDSAGRKLLTKRNIELLLRRAKCSIYEHSAGESDVALLQQDLRTGLHHVFGDHLACRPGICNTIGTQIDNKIPVLKTTLIYNHINGVLNLLVRKASLLISNETNNRSERLMNIVARFNMGKRLNLIQRGSYERRVYLSGLRYNKSLKYHESPWKKFTGKSPGKYFKSYFNKNIRRAKSGCSKKLFKDERQVNNDYGPLADQPEEDNELISMECDLLMQQLQVTVEERDRIAEASVGQFGSPSFIEERRMRLTASLFGRVIRKRPYTSCHNIVKDCLHPRKRVNDAVEYGIVKEEVAIRLFEKKTNLEVRSTGLWVDLSYGFLGASPDGLVEDGSIIEVKCLFSCSKQNYKNIDELISDKKNKTCLCKKDGCISLKRTHPYYYQVQVQGQLHITNKEKCYFVVYVNDSIDIHIEEIFKDDAFWGENMFPMLQQFYLDCIGPEIIRNNIGKGKQCVNPPYILEALAKRTEYMKKKKVQVEKSNTENLIESNNESKEADDEVITFMLVDSDID